MWPALLITNLPDSSIRTHFFDCWILCHPYAMAPISFFYYIFLHSSLLSCSGATEYHSTTKMCEANGFQSLRSVAWGRYGLQVPTEDPIYPLRGTPHCLCTMKHYTHDQHIISFSCCCNNIADNSSLRNGLSGLMVWEDIVGGSTECTQLQTWGGIHAVSADRRQREVIAGT